MNLNIPFYSNTSDDTHCFQATIRGVAKYFWPLEDYSWEELDRLSAKVDGLWTWPSAGLLWFKQKGVDVKIVDMLDYAKFAEEGGKYLIDEYGEEVGSAQIKNSNIEQEKLLAKRLIDGIGIEMRIPDVSDIKKLLDEGFVLICNINSLALNNKSGYVGHFVVVKGYDNDGLFLNDPGLPPYENRKVAFLDFERAWAYPNEKAKNIMAFRLIKKS